MSSSDSDSDSECFGCESIMFSRRHDECDERKNQKYLNLHEMQTERFKVFESQDLENGRFDVTFEIDGKKLLAHTFILTSVSKTLNSWLSDRWTTRDANIKIEDYTYDNFYEFICFLYICDCKLTQENACKMVDMAEFYGVPCLKEFCDKFLSKMEIQVETMEEMFEFADKYSLKELKESIRRYFLHNAVKVCKSEAFFAFKKCFVEFLYTATSSLSVRKKEIGFEYLYKWAEHRVMKQGAADDDNFNLLGAIKTELDGIFPNYQFCEMSFEFLMNFVVKKGFVLSPTEMLHFVLYHKPKDVQQQIAFRNTYELAKKQALKKQEMFPEENFNLVDSIKGYLISVIPHVEFSRMPKSFITDFVVANGIISVEQANHIFDIQVEIKNNGKIVNGIIKDDDISIRGAIEKMKFCKMTRQSTTKIRFLKLKFTVPKTPSSVQKMKGCEWYLCLESDGMLTFKHHSIVQKSDYLLAEMKSNEKFQLTPGKTTFLFARFNNVS